MPKVPSDVPSDIVPIRIYQDFWLPRVVVYKFYPQLFAMNNGVSIPTKAYSAGKSETPLESIDSLSPVFGANRL